MLCIVFFEVQVLDGVSALEVFGKLDKSEFTREEGSEAKRKIIGSVNIV